MKVFIVYAHPEPQSLNGQLKDHAVKALEQAGHEVIVSDLYAMKFKAVADGDDFLDHEPSEKLQYALASGKAYRDGTQAPDIVAEQEKMFWADVIIFQFPVWWYGMPAILKGWVDRVYARGFAYGIGTHDKTKYGVRFGEGKFEGKRGMIVTTVGGKASHYGPRGVNGNIDDILWPINHGALYYVGMTVVPPLVFYDIKQITAEKVEQFCSAYEERVLGINDIEPIHYRSQNGGDYDEFQTLLPGLESPDSKGLEVHQKAPIYRANVEVAGNSNHEPIHFARDSRSR